MGINVKIAVGFTFNYQYYHCWLKRVAIIVRYDADYISTFMRIRLLLFGESFVYIILSNIVDYFCENWLVSESSHLYDILHYTILQTCMKYQYRTDIKHTCQFITTKIGGHVKFSRSWMCKGTDPRSIHLCPQCQWRGVFFKAMDNKVTKYIKMFHKYPNYSHITLECHIFQHIVYFGIARHMLNVKMTLFCNCKNNTTMFWACLRWYP